MNARPNIEFETVPWANDVAIDGIEGKAGRGLRFIQFFDYPGENGSLTDWAALMGARIFVGENLSVQPKKADRYGSDVDDQALLLAKVSASASFHDVWHR